MQTRELGVSGLQLSVLGLGCWALGGGSGWGDQDERKAIATIHAALDLGINWLDTAEAYADGYSEQVVGRALVGRRTQALVATKISPSNATSPATLRAHFEASLRRLGSDYIDLYQIHWPVDDESLADACATLQALQAEGKVRAIGVSNHGVQQLSAVLDAGLPVSSNQMCYNLLARAIEFAILPLCQQHNIGIIAYMPLMQGLLAGKYSSPDEVPAFRARTRHFSSARPEARHGGVGAERETFEALRQVAAISAELGHPMSHVALAWAAAKPGVTSVLVGSRSVEQIRENAAAATWTLPPAALAQLDQATEALRLALGPNADYWQGDETTRTR